MYYVKCGELSVTLLCFMCSNPVRRTSKQRKEASQQFNYLIKIIRTASGLENLISKSRNSKSVTLSTPPLLTLTRKVNFLVNSNEDFTRVILSIKFLIKTILLKVVNLVWTRT